jgi:hypothetical protein
LWNKRRNLRLESSEGTRVETPVRRTAFRVLRGGTPWRTPIREKRERSCQWTPLRGPYRKTPAGDFVWGTT